MSRKKSRKNTVKRTGKNSFTLTFSKKAGERMARRLNEGEGLSVEMAFDEALNGDARDAVEGFVEETAS